MSRPASNHPNDYIEQTRELNIARKLQREQAAWEQKLAMKGMQQQQLNANVMRGAIPHVPNGPERMSPYDQAEMARRHDITMGAAQPRSMTGLPETKRIPTALTGPATPQNTGVTGVTGVNAGTPDFGSTRTAKPTSTTGLPGVVETPATAPSTAPYTQPAFGTSRRIAGTLESYMPDDSKVKGGGRWVGTTSETRIPIPAAQSGLSTVIRDQALGRGMTQRGDGTVEYDPRRDEGRETATGPNSRTIDPRYRTPASQIGKGEIVGSGKAAPLPGEGVLTPATATAANNPILASQAPAAPAANPNAWHADIIAKHPEIGVAGTWQNKAFVDAFKQHNDPLRAMETANQIATNPPAGTTPAAPVPAPSPATAHNDIPGDRSAAYNIGQSIGNAPGAVRGFVNDKVLNPLNRAASAVRDSAMDLTAGVTGKTPGQVRDESEASRNPNVTKGMNMFSANFGAPPTSMTGLPVGPAPSSITPDSSRHSDPFAGLDAAGKVVSPVADALKSASDQFKSIPAGNPVAGGTSPLASNRMHEFSDPFTAKNLAPPPMNPAFKGSSPMPAKTPGQVEVLPNAGVAMADTQKRRRMNGLP